MEQSNTFENSFVCIDFANSFDNNYLDKIFNLKQLFRKIVFIHMKK